MCQTTRVIFNLNHRDVVRVYGVLSEELRRKFGEGLGDVVTIKPRFTERYGLSGLYWRTLAGLVLNELVRAGLARKVSRRRYAFTRESLYALSALEEVAEGD